MKANDFATPKPQEDRSRYEQGARDVIKGADPDHIARVRNLDPDLLTKYVGYAWDKVNSGEYKLNRPNLEEDLRKWFREKWVRFGPDGKIRGDCARGSDTEGKPKCLPQSKAHALGKKGRASAAARKRRQDPNPERTGKAINVATKKNTNEASEINLKTALSLAQDIHGAVQDLRELIQAGQQIRNLSQLRSEIVSLNQQLQDLGYDYDPDSARHLVPLTIDNQPQVKLKEYPDTPMKMQDYLRQAKDLHSRMMAASKAMDKQEFELLKKEREELDRRARAGMIAERSCPQCGGPAFGNLLLAEKKDACYHKVRSRYKVWPSAYASGALVQCRKKGAANWGNKSESVEAGIQDQLKKEWRNYQGLRPAKNELGVNLFPGRDIVGQRVYHCTNRLKSIYKSGGLKPKYDETGAREYGRLSTDKDPFIPVIGIWFSVGRPDWPGRYCLSWVVEPSDKTYRAYADGPGLPNIVLNPISMDRITVVDTKTGKTMSPEDLESFVAEESISKPWSARDIETGVGSHLKPHNVQGATNDKGLTQSQWLEQVKKQFDSQIKNIKMTRMVDGPVLVILNNGEKLMWSKSDSSDQQIDEGFLDWLKSKFKKNDADEPVDDWFSRLPQEEQDALHASYYKTGRDPAYKSGYERHQARINPSPVFQGAHGSAENELKMFLNGTKPAALVSDVSIPLWKNVINSGKYIVKKVKEHDGETGYVLGQPGEEDRVEKLTTLYQTAQDAWAQGNTTIFQNSNYHRWMGKLLGYPAEKIEAFIMNYFRDKQDTAKKPVYEAQSAKTGIYQTDVLGAKAYHAKCMEPKCDWESKRFDKIKQAQAAAEKHAKGHFKRGVAEGIEGELWRVLEPRNIGGHAARYYVVKGDGKTLKIWRSKSGAGDFVKRADAEAKAKELNQGVAEGLNEFAPAGSGGGTPPRGPRVPGGPGGGDDGAGEDPYGRPKPQYYARSSSYFEQFEADHFDREDFDKATGVFKGYWQKDDGSFVQIGYFKFDDPRRTGGDDPGMGWYYEPEGLSESYLGELSPELLKRASDAASAKYDIAADYGNRLPADTAQALMKHYGQQSARFAQGAKSAQQRDAEKATLSKIGMSDVARRKTGMNENDPWGPAGRFAGDVNVDISSTVEKFQPQVGQTVKVRDGNIKGLGEITRIKGDTAAVWIHSYAREFEVPMSAISAAEVRESRSAIASAIAAAKL